MDAIYGGRPTSIGREGALDSATPLLENTIEDDSLSMIDSLAFSPCNDDDSSQPVISASPPRPPTPSPSTSSCTTTPQHVVTGTRKRSLHHQEHLAVLREMQVADIQQQELNRAQREHHLQMALEEARQAREQEAALRAEEHSQMAAFNQAFLNWCYLLPFVTDG